MGLPCTLGFCRASCCTLLLADRRFGTDQNTQAAWLGSPSRQTYGLCHTSFGMGRMFRAALRCSWTNCFCPKSWPFFAGNQGVSCLPFFRIRLLYMLFTFQTARTQTLYLRFLKISRETQLGGGCTLACVGIRSASQVYDLHLVKRDQLLLFCRLRFLRNTFLRRCTSSQLHLR